MTNEWVLAGAFDDIDEEDVMGFDHGGKTYAVYRTMGDKIFATDGLCTHEQQHLAEGDSYRRHYRMPVYTRGAFISRPARRKARRYAST